MMKAGSSVHLRPHCFSVYSLMSFSKMSLPSKVKACSSRLEGSLPFSAATASAFCSSIFAVASAGVFTPHSLLKVFILKGRL